MKNRKLPIIVITIIVVLIISRLGFNEDTQIKAIELEEVVATLEDAYEIANEYLKENCEGAILVGYGLDVGGKDAIQNEQPHEYHFQFACPGTENLKEEPIERYYIVVNTDDNSMTIEEYTIAKQFENVHLGYEISEIDITRVLTTIKENTDVDRIGDLLNADPKSQIGIKRSIFIEELDGKKNAYIVFAGPTEIDGGSFSYYVDIDDGEVKLRE